MKNKLLLLTSFIICFSGFSQNWKSYNLGTKGDILTTMVIGHLNDTIYASGLNNNVAKNSFIYSKDKGDTWSNVNNIFTETNGSVAQYVGVKDRVYASVQLVSKDYLYYHSKDNGANWVLDTIGLSHYFGIKSYHKERFILKKMGEDYVVAISGTKSFYKKVDDASWAPLIPSTVATSNKEIVQIGNTWYSLNNYKSNNENHTITKSTDNGKTWQTITKTGLPDGYRPTSLVSNGVDKLFVSTTTGTTHTRDVFYSNDGGETWQPTNASTIVQHEYGRLLTNIFAHKDEVIVTYSNGLFNTGSWYTLPVGLDVHFIALAFINNTPHVAIVPATITIQVYKLQAPNHILRTRKWQAPDTPLLSEQEFKALFPHEAYTDEDNIAQWKKGALVFEETIDTKNRTTLELNTLDWKSGNYVIVAKGKDTFDIAIEQEKRFLLTNSKDTYLADNKLFGFEILNTKTAKKDGVISVKLLTADNNLHVLTEAYFCNKIIYKESTLINGNKTLRVPLVFLDKGDINPNSSVLLQFSLTRFNQHLTKTTTVSLAETKEQLTIETKTFRNKLQPAAKEKWSFTVKNKKGIQAEVLASMYDASLDQFKPHNWTSSININDYYYNNYARKSSSSFNSSSFRLMNARNSSNLSFHKQHSKLNNFGFTLYSIQKMLKGKASGISIEHFEEEAELEESNKDT